MSKPDFLRLSCVFFVALAVLTLLMLAFPVERGAVFQIVWLFSAGALAITFFVAWTRVFNARTRRGQLYGFTMLRICAVYLTLQLLLGLIFLLLGSRIEAVTAALALFLLLCAAAALLAAEESARESADRTDRRQAASMVGMAELIDRAERLACLYETESLRRLAEDFRYSDPVSRPDLAFDERDLSVLLDRLERALKSSGTPSSGAGSVEALIHSLSAALAERNRRCFRGKN